MKPNSRNQQKLLSRNERNDKIVNRLIPTSILLLRERTDRTKNLGVASNKTHILLLVPIARGVGVS